MDAKQRGEWTNLVRWLYALEKKGSSEKRRICHFVDGALVKICNSSTQMEILSWLGEKAFDGDRFGVREIYARPIVVQILIYFIHLDYIDFELCIKHANGLDLEKASSVFILTRWYRHIQHIRWDVYAHSDNVDNFKCLINICTTIMIKKKTITTTWTHKKRHIFVAHFPSAVYVCNFMYAIFTKHSVN